MQRNVGFHAKAVAKKQKHQQRSPALPKPTQKSPSVTHSSVDYSDCCPTRHLPSATVSNLTLRPRCRTICTPPASIHRPRFLHWLTSRTSRSLQPSTTASTPVPVTRTHPRTDRLRSSSRCREMQRSEVSETAEPQKARLRWVRLGRPRARTSVAVSERAQQNDYRAPLAIKWVQSGYKGRHTRSSSLRPLAAFVKYTIALSVK